MKNQITKSEMHDKINDIFIKVSFRKFGNAFRKHIDETFAQAYNLKSAGGQLDSSWTWRELAGYIIGDGDYDITQEQFDNFMSEFK